MKFYNIKDEYINYLKKYDAKVAFYFDNAALVSFSRIETAFKGAAQESGFKNEKEMQEYMKDIRKVEL